MRTFREPDFDFNGKAILITGGTGSFGRAFIRLMLDRFKPRRLVVYSRDELKQFEMAQVFCEAEHPCLRYFIGDVRDESRLEMALAGIDCVVHAAAMKQVPTAEYNPFECIHTNVIGAENVVRASIRARVKKVIALSTDKAANPINLYGASKLASDKIFVAGNHLAGADGPRFSVVRYGNVVGSRGSVVPLFQKLAKEGAGHVPVTHAEMTRFWITLEQGVNMVMSSFAMMQGGEVFIPKIPSMKIVDLARVIAPRAEVKIVGIRPGEKLHEIMVTEDDARQTIELADRYIILPAFAGWLEKNVEEVHVANNGARRVAARFAYASDTNVDWLQTTDFQRVMKAAGLA